SQAEDGIRARTVTAVRRVLFRSGLLIAYDQYDGQAPAAGVITGLTQVSGREVVIVANDATVKAGSWWPETIKKILRAQEIAMRRSEERRVGKVVWGRFVAGVLGK